MNPLADIIAQRIQAGGPISLAEYMATCLLHPDHGYYSTRDPFGTAGDFITAPEISQMFGELIGLALAQSWQDQGAPSFTLAELGPGRGTLMADILRATAKVPGFHAAADLCLIEASPALRAAQTKVVPRARHLTTVNDLPDAPLFVVANEFFDALPIRQFTRRNNGWAETMVGLNGNQLKPGAAAPAAIDVLHERLIDTAEGDIVEICPALPDIIHTLSDRIARRGGAALIIDYGDWGSLGDTFQALQDHQPVDPFAMPGQADLTAHVDFAAIAAHAAPATYSRLTPQGVFLERLGITARAQALARSLTGTALDRHIAAHRRLTHPAEMGDHFKVMGLWPTGAAPLPGLMP